MKQCPVCKSTYTDDSLSFCLNDGAALAALSSSEVTQQMSFGSNPTVENNRPIRVNIQSETPTQFSIPRNTTQAERKGNSPFLILTIVCLIAIIGAGGIALAYFAIIKSGNSVPTSTPTPTATVTATPIQNNTSDETQALKDKLEKLEKQLNEQKNAKSNLSVSNTPTSQETPYQTTVTARVNSPNDGFLALRSNPSVQSGYQLLQIPHGASVSVIGCQGYTTIGNRRGRWCRVNYAGQQGWSFDGFLIY